MYELGGLEEKKEETKNETSVEKTEEKRKPFHYWTVGGRDYRLKLKASTIGKLEKFKWNLLSFVTFLPLINHSIIFEGCCGNSSGISFVSTPST